MRRTSLLNFIIPAHIANALIIGMTLTMLVLGYLLIFVPDPISERVKSHADLIVISSPVRDAVVSHAFRVAGKARGQWFFEGSFPVEVLNTNNVVLWSGVAQSEGEWMTEEFVPFSAAVVLPAAYEGMATVVLHKDNPSGLPEHNDFLSVPVIVR